MSDTLAGLSPKEITDWFDNAAAPAPGSFEIALVLGGTGSSGAYTAGVLDFLIEALDGWAKRRAAQDPSAPAYNVAIRYVAGTSGGGVNAAIFARAMAFDFPPVSQGTSPATAVQNPFYDTWVNQLTLASLLTTSDLDAPGAKPVSILNGQGIDDAAGKVTAFTGAPAAAPRGWLGMPLRLFLTLTNLNGMPYRVDFGSMILPDGSTAKLQQSYVEHADFARFAILYPGQSLTAPADGATPLGTDARPDEFALCFDDTRLPNALQWSDFGQFACATAAIPIGLPPRALTRPLCHYRYRVVAVPGDGTAGAPGSGYQALVPDIAAIEAWPGSAGGIPVSYRFLVVDGGVTDNEPIELARTALAGISGRNPRDGAVANRAVLLIDPFAGSTAMAPPLQLDLPDLTGALINTVLQQTRYDTRDILLAANPGVFSRFMISAQRGTFLGDQALATSGLGALIGFASDAFRRHDYMLGRKNCQDFLKSGLVLPAANPLFDAWRDTAAAKAMQVTDGSGAAFLPIIPLIGNCTVPETLDPWPVGKLDPGIYRPAIEARFDKLLAAETADGPLSDILSWLAAKAAQSSVADFVIGNLKSALAAAGL
jgi:hypothetical protein